MSSYVVYASDARVSLTSHEAIVFARRLYTDYLSVRCVVSVELVFVATRSVCFHPVYHPSNNHNNMMTHG